MVTEVKEEAAIELVSVTKRFRTFSERPQSLKTILVQLLKGKMSLGQVQDHTALEDLTFSVQPGEFLGIMGKNGAGKSTLLKVICGIYQPSSGVVRVKGTVAPMIELGAGFNANLSGYENIFLNAAVLGFGRRVTKKALPNILEFAELGDQIHAPVRTYSSGMLVRLGFSIVTHLEAPILLIDEILAVGDLEFQEKCINKIRELHLQGRTIILITHNPEAIEKYCTRGIVVDGQHKVFDGSPIAAAVFYKGIFEK